MDVRELKNRVGKSQGYGRKWMKVDENGQKWINVYESEWQFLQVDESGW